jgi:hypothetical protein
VATSPPAWLTMSPSEFEDEFRPTQNASSAYLHRVLIRALSGSSLDRIPEDEQLTRKPLVLELAPSLPSRLRFYVYKATQHASERQQGTFKVQLTRGVPANRGSRRLYFDRSGGIRPILVGYHVDLRLFILWDADLHDSGDGFPFSKNVQAPPDVVWRAVARGLATGRRTLKRPAATEEIVVARPLRLAEALELRIRLSNAALCEGMF